MNAALALSENLLDKIIAEIKKNNPVEVYWDRGDSVSIETIIHALQQQEHTPLAIVRHEIEAMNEHWFDQEMESITGALQRLEKEIQAELFPEGNPKVNFKELAMSLRGELIEHIQINDNVEGILPRLNVRIELKSNYDCINSHWFEQTTGGYSYEESYFGDVIDQLGLSPWKVKVMLHKYGVKCVGNWPHKNDSKRLIEYEPFFQEIENRSCGASLFCFVATIATKDFLAAYKEEGMKLTIPKGNLTGFFSSFQGGGSTIEAPLLRDFTIELNKAMDESGYLKFTLEIDHGRYSIDNAYGVTKKFWGNEIKIQTK